MRHMNAIATPESAPDAGLGAFTKEVRLRTGSRRAGKLDKFSYPWAEGCGPDNPFLRLRAVPALRGTGRGVPPHAVCGLGRRHRIRREI